MGFIYKIINKSNNGYYIGSTARQAEHRFKEHRYNLRHNKHKNPKLQNAWNKYGENNFKFVVFQEIENQLLEKIEEELIKKLSPKYNISPSAQGGMRNKKHTEITKKQISQKLKGRVSPNKGNKYSERTRRKQSKVRKGKTYEEIFGVEKAKELRELRRKSIFTNGMWSKPQPQIRL